MALLSVRAIAVLLPAIVFTAAPAYGGGPDHAVSEYEVKAAYLYNFVKFVEWPADAMNSGGELAICTLGDNPFGGALEASVAGKTFGGQAIVTRHVNGAAQARSCRILFVTAAAGKSFRSMSGELKTSGILTVGEADGFLGEGGVINFRLESGRVRLQVNIAAAEQQRLRISAKLLSVAEVIK